MSTRSIITAGKLLTTHAKPTDTNALEVYSVSTLPKVILESVVVSCHTAGTATIIINSSGTDFSYAQAFATANTISTIELGFSMRVNDTVDVQSSTGNYFTFGLNFTEFDDEGEDG